MQFVDSVSLSHCCFTTNYCQNSVKRQVKEAMLHLLDTEVPLGTQLAIRNLPLPFLCNYFSNMCQNNLKNLNNKCIFFKNVYSRKPYLIQFNLLNQNLNFTTE